MEMRYSFFPKLVLVALLLCAGGGPLHSESLTVKTKTFLSPPFFLRPGEVCNKFFYDIDFPRGHLALKSFNGEVVDDCGVPVLLHETYLHHWTVGPYFAAAAGDERPMFVSRNAGVCTGKYTALGQYYGLGSETRRTATWVPDPYGVEIGDPARPPPGYAERWALNLHAIDTRGVADRQGCTECKCALYNVTVDEYGRYVGGLLCCYDGTRCAVPEALAGADEPRKLFMRYTVMWQDWSDAIVPVKIYIFDVTDRALIEGRNEPECLVKLAFRSIDGIINHFDPLQVEYDVEECSSEDRAKNACLDVAVAKQVLPRGGDIVFGVAHQHAGGIGASLHGEDGRLLCASKATYGKGQEAGDEAGYIVGMSTCYPAPGTVTARDGEVLTVVANYSSEKQHLGVMGLFYILVAEPQPQQKPAGLCFSFPVSCESAI